MVETEIDGLLPIAFDKEAQIIIKNLVMDNRKPPQLLPTMLHHWHVFIKYHTDTAYFLYVVYDSHIIPRSKDGPDIVFSTHGTVEYLTSVLTVFSEMTPDEVVDLLRKHGLFHACAMFWCTNGRNAFL